MTFTMGLGQLIPAKKIKSTVIHPKLGVQHSP